MAPKAKPVAGTKRKSAPSGGKSEGSGPTKKVKFGSARKNLMVKDDAESDSNSDDDDDGSFGGLSDSEDGGAAVSAKKDGRKPAQNFEKGKPYNNNSSNSNGVVSGQNSREAHAKQRQLAQERKAAKPLADELHRLKKLWEKLRRKSHLPKEERQGLVEELYGIITGRVKDFVLKHDAVRAVQTAVKYANASQRKQVARELQGTYAQLAESRYAKFLIGKLLVQNDDEIRDLIIPEFYGKVRKLINHPEASWILDDVYRGVATKYQKATLLREWYGPEFVLFKPDGAEPSADLPKILENEPSKRPTVLKYLFDMINGLIQKKMTGFTMLHDAMLQYFLSLKPESEELKEFIEIIKEDENGDLLKNMAFTKSGARLVCLLLAHGNAKDRRAILKTYKDTFQLMCGDDHGHMVILAAYDVIDDTVATAKAIFPEVIGKEKEKTVENVIFLANNLNARTTICYLFEGPSKSLFPASHASDLALLEEVHQIRETTSKKNPDIRRQELIAAVSPPLLAALAASPNDLVQTSFGCQFVTDVLLSAVGDKTEALEAIASTAAGDPNEPIPEDAYPPPPPHVSLTPHGGRMFKTLISGGRYDKAAGAVKPVDPPLKFADIIYPVIKDHVIAWATGPSSFTVLGLLEAADFSSADELKKTLRASANKKKLEKAAREETLEQRTKREVAAAAAEAADEKVKDTKAKSKAKAKGKKEKAGGQHNNNKDKQAQPVGNQGTKLLLARL